MLDLDNRIMSSAHAGAATLVGPIWNPRFESSIFNQSINQCVKARSPGRSRHRMAEASGILFLLLCIFY